MIMMVFAMMVRWFAVMVGSMRLSMVVLVCVMATVMLVIELVVGTVSMMLDLLRVVVEDTDAVESNHDEEEEVDADEDPDEVIGEVSAAIPVHPVDQIRIAHIDSILSHLVGEETVPDDVDEEDDEANAVGHIERLSRVMVVSANEAEDKPDRENRVDHDADDVTIAD